MELERLRRLAGVSAPVIVESVEEVVETLTEAEMAKIDSDIAAMVQRINKAKTFGQRAMGNPSIANTAKKTVIELTGKLEELKKKRDVKPSGQSKGMKSASK